MSKKVGLAITTYTHNYGSFLQSFALVETIKRLGYTPEVISTKGVQILISSARRKYFLKRMFNINELLSYSVMFKGIGMKLINKDYAKNQKIRGAAFDRFRDKYFSFSPVGHTWEEIGNICKDYCAVVVGSDQLWRPANIEGGYFTLEFVPDEINKVAYAPSFGIPRLEKPQAEKVKYFIPRLNHIGVREERGQQIIKELTGIDVPVVCDPTLLFTKEDWDSYVGDRLINDDYVLTYFIGDHEDYLRFAKRLGDYWGIKVVGIVHIDGYNNNISTYIDDTPYDIDPFQFINLVKFAKCVLTDSFHCSVFSIHFEKEFFAFKRFSDTNTMSTNNRLTTLFNVAGIEGRILSGKEDISDSLFKPINYSVVRENIQKKRDFSMDYLSNALANV